jgi:pyruvate dehydrogenase E2 component (dihydrolipoamide acetyltransferase)
MVGVHTCADVTLSGDHRVSDGLTGARFLQRIEHYLSHPEEL